MSALNSRSAVPTVVVTGCVTVPVLVASQLFSGSVPLGVVLMGALLGTGTGLMAVGLVLTYRTSGVINFGYGAMGTVGAGVAAISASSRGYPWVACLALATLAGLISGALFERLVVRPLATAPRLMLTVATIGLAQAGPGLAPYMADWFNVAQVLTKIHTPWVSFEVKVSPVVFNGNDFALLAAVPLVLGPLTWFLLRTEAGMAVRAMVDNRERARLLGIPVGRLSLLVWSLTGGIAALTVALRTPNEGIAFNAAAGATALLPALAAAVLTRMTSMTRAFLAGIGIGVLDQLVRWNVDRQATTTVVLLGVIVAGLLVQRALSARSSARVADSEESSWVGVLSGRRLPAPLARLPEVRAARGILLLALVGALAAIPLLGTSSQVNYATVTLVYAIVAVSLVVLTGWGGVVSLGQIAFMGVGGVVTANLIADHNAELLVMLTASAAAGGLIALLLGLPALRVSGQFLVATTLAFAVAMQLYVLNPTNNASILPSSYPRPELLGRLPLSDERWLYLLALGVLVVSVLMVGNLRRARTGRAIIAGRDNDRAAAAAGVNTVRARLVAFTLAGVFAGLAGAIHAIALRGIGFNTYESSASLLVFSMVVIGGAASLPGALAGVALVQWLGYAFPNLQLLVTGIGLQVMIVNLPGGLAQVFERTRDRLALLAARARGLPLIDELPVAGDGATPSPGTPSPDGNREWPRADEPIGARGGDGDRAEPLLRCQGVEASYGTLQVLFGIDTEVAAGEMTAMLGTNGAGKSTLLKSVAGLLPAKSGRVTFDGRDITKMPAEKIARLGLSLMPGGKGVFPNLTVAENLRLACWMIRHDGRVAAGARDEAMAMFPILGERRHQVAGNLSGGEQQQLSLAMAFVARPKLLCIDELSLGLAPTVVEQLVDKVREIHRSGTTVVVVEQSVNVALLLCERTVFLEKGQVRFRGTTAGLLDRPEVLRAVFIGAGSGTVHARPADDRPATRPSRGVELECRNLVKRFGGIRAIDGVDLTVRPGTIVGVIGHNGAGKTTLFDLITGYLPADGGRVVLGGRDVTRSAPHRRAHRELGRSFQEARLFPSLTVADTLRIGLERHLANRDPIAAAFHLPASVDAELDASERVDELVELLGLGIYRDRFTSELSTGTRRIVELGVLLAQNPAVVLLDEPSAGIAQRETEALGPMLRRVQAETGCSMVVIEHDINLLTTLCDEFVAMELGAVIARGTPDEVLSDPRVITSYLGTSDHVIHRSGPRLAGATVAGAESPEAGPG